MIVPKLVEDKEYLKKAGQICPFCKSHDISAGVDTHIDCTVAWNEVTCNECGKKWNDIFQLIGYEEIKEEENDGDNELR